MDLEFPLVAFLPTNGLELEPLRQGHGDGQREVKKSRAKAVTGSRIGAMTASRRATWDAIYMRRLWLTRS
jgi:hypothetical protein